MVNGLKVNNHICGFVDKMYYFYVKTFERLFFVVKYTCFEILQIEIDLSNVAAEWAVSVKQVIYLPFVSGRSRLKLNFRVTDRPQYFNKEAGGRLYAELSTTCG